MSGCVLRVGTATPSRTRLSKESVETQPHVTRACPYRAARGLTGQQAFAILGIDL